MELTVQQEKFQKAIGLVEKITSKNSTLPILNNILLKTENGRLKISATNLEIGINSVIGAKISSEGQIAIPGRILSDFIKNSRGEIVKLKTNQNSLNIDTGSYKTSILGFDASEYPIIPKIKNTEGILISVIDLKKILNSVTDSIALSESRPELSGALIKFSDDRITAAATDSFRLVEQKIKIKNKISTSIILPRGAIIELSRILGDITGDINIYITDNQISFNHEDFELVSRLIDGKYPDYTKVIPDKALSKVLVRKDDIEGAIKTGALFSSSISDIHIECKPDKLSISAKNSSKGEVNAVIEVNLKGDPFDISLNYHYLLDGLKIIDTDKLVIEFTGTGSPFVLKPNNEEKDIVYVIMPLRA